MARTVLVKSDNMVPGVGDLPAEELWSSDPDECGQFVHLSEADDGTLYLSFTDMEERGGSYASVPVRDGDLGTLLDLLLQMWETASTTDEAEDFESEE